MPQNIELPFRSISFRSDLQVMVVRWHTYAPLEVVQADYELMLVAAEERGICDWLLGVRRRDKVTPELSAWVSHEFYPQATQRLAPRRLRMAVLNSPALTEAYVMDPAWPFDIGLFDDEGAAMRWLCPEIGACCAGFASRPGNWSAAWSMRWQPCWAATLRQH